MKYLFVLFALFSLRSFAQDYPSVIASHREHYKQDFITNTRSPLKKENLADLHFFEADSSYAVKANIAFLIDEKSFQMPTYSGDSKEYVRYAILKFTLGGQPQQLTVYKSIALSKILTYKDYLFLPFTDESNGSDTYGGGRYIDLNAKDMTENDVMIDFNKAYNPYCAYSDGYQCPKPPEENHLNLKVNAGEKKYGGTRKQLD
ncbi:DUF1684 domain-containing protein [Pedobacter sp. AW31-3R]|uniref:DUF1684 domain-containing protein n=1 Tax=Pedobacter sp. AW31-3R TaxID=3445781 RepID=UPI003FA03A8E